MECIKTQNQALLKDLERKQDALKIKKREIENLKRQSIENLKECQLFFEKLKARAKIAEKVALALHDSKMKLYEEDQKELNEFIQKIDKTLDQAEDSNNLYQLKRLLFTDIKTHPMIKQYTIIELDNKCKATSFNVKEVDEKKWVEWAMIHSINSC